MTTTSESTGRKFLFLLASTRADGNTEALARRAAAALPAGVEQRWLRLSDLPLPTFEDIRHAERSSYPEPTGNAKVLLDATLDATDLVIASPLYWYNLSASAKLYLDHWAGWLRVPGLDFKARMAGRTIWAVTALASENPAAADPLVGAVRYSGEYLGMAWGGALLGHANSPGQILDDEAALRSADDFFVPAAVR
ncbi:flavodoxin family protein [Kitasatospora sp. NPDC052896]|uniref:flavodoxin family protein n=1 Tax=Kitasatospora sp. NPDC052896 TaxID=3364061 RepID=UPI0037C68232